MHNYYYYYKAPGYIQVGLFEDNKVYIVCGSAVRMYNGIRFLSFEQLKKYTKVQTTYASHFV